MVYEFTDLQGVIGSYYAKEFGESEAVYLGISEQYLPDSESSPLPSNKHNAIVALSSKLDLLFALFSIERIPTGSKDPFALRRAVLGIIKIVLHFKLDFDIQTLCGALQEYYKKFDNDKIVQFFYERLLQYFDVNKSLINAVIEAKETNILEFAKKVQALEQIVQKDNFKEDFATFKRVANILEDQDKTQDVSVDANLFESDYERNLHQALAQIKGQKYDNYLLQLEALFSIQSVLSDFFEHIMVNAKDANIKRNRKNLLRQIYNEFKQIADIKVIGF